MGRRQDTSQPAPAGTTASLNAALEVLVEAQADVLLAPGVPFVDCCRPLMGHEQWQVRPGREPGPRTTPGRPATASSPWLVLHNGWYDWLQVSGDARNDLP